MADQHSIDQRTRSTPILTAAAAVLGVMLVVLLVMNAAGVEVRDWWPAVMVVGLVVYAGIVWRLVSR